MIRWQSRSWCVECQLVGSCNYWNQIKPSQQSWYYCKALLWTVTYHRLWNRMRPSCPPDHPIAPPCYRRPSSSTRPETVATVTDIERTLTHIAFMRDMRPPQSRWSCQCQWAAQLQLPSLIALPYRVPERCSGLGATCPMSDDRACCKRCLP